LASGELRVGLFGPGMTALHKAGLAGLWMTLAAFDEDPAAKRRLEAAGGSWTLSERDVVLRWSGDAGGFFDALVKESFRVDKDGLVWFPALGEPSGHKQASAILNECLLGTFLQHGKIRKSDPASKPSGTVVEVVDEKQYPLRYHRVAWYQHQKVRIDDSEAPQRLLGWVYPGSAVRHEAFDETGIREPLDRFLPLLYAMVGVLYFIIRGKGVRLGSQRYAVVVPVVANLAEYARLRRIYAPRGERELTVSGPGEAALRVLATLEANRLTDAVGLTACRVVSFGRVQWDKQQKKRIEVFDVGKDRLDGLRLYRLSAQVFPSKLVRPEGAPPFWDYPLTPELVAENVLAGRPWWRGFADFVSDQSVRNHLYRWEREGLAKMVQSPEGMPEGAQRAFVEACQEAWRRRLGALGERARRENTDFGGLAGRELEATRVSFSKCKNAVTLREVVTGFWAKAGPLPSLQSDWRSVLTLLNGDWRLAKDLALLALASYSPRERLETAAAP
jgi:CRISPR-associated protein Cas8a1/Csx13